MEENGEMTTNFLEIFNRASMRSVSIYAHSSIKTSGVLQDEFFLISG